MTVLTPRPVKMILLLIWRWVAESPAVTAEILSIIGSRLVRSAAPSGPRVYLNRPLLLHRYTAFGTTLATWTKTLDLTRAGRVVVLHKNAWIAFVMLKATCSRRIDAVILLTITS